MRSRRQFLIQAGSAAAAALIPAPLVHAAEPAPAPAGAATMPARPNILWVFADDVGLEFGCYGDKTVRTPHIDRIASEGVRYTQVFTAAPVCSPSRSAFATGMMPTSIGAQHQRNASQPLPGEVRVLSHILRDAGYFTACGWESIPEHAPQELGKVDYNFICERPFEGNHWSQRAAGQPFYMNVTWGEPHRPFRTHATHPVDPASVTVPEIYPDIPETRQDWALYLDMIQNFDDHVGELRAALERDGLWEDTIVVVLGDNGRPHLRDKQWLYDGGLRVPMIIRIPEQWRTTLGLESCEPGSTVDRLISGIDLAPTMLSMIGLPVPAWMEGQAFLGDQEAPSRGHLLACRDRIDDTPDRIRAVRTLQYKYIRNFHPERPYLQYNFSKEINFGVLPAMRRMHEAGQLTAAQAQLFGARPAEEFYDLLADPNEVRNLIDDPSVQQPLAEMRGMMDEWLETRGDTGAAPEPPEYVARSRAKIVKAWEALPNKEGLRAPSYE